MTAQPCKHRDREAGPVDSPRRTAGPPLEGGIALGAASCAGRDSRGGRLAYSADEAVRLPGPSRDLLHGQMRHGDLAYVKAGRRRLITLQHLQQFLGIAS
jgi:hypothetical protein